jgi:antitoxin ParD1/3/4
MLRSQNKELGMNVSVGQRWEEFVASVVATGRYGSASEVVREGLRLVEEREARLQALRDTLNAAIERGGSHTDEEVAAAVEAALDQVFDKADGA